MRFPPAGLAKLFSPAVGRSGGAIQIEPRPLAGVFLAWPGAAVLKTQTSNDKNRTLIPITAPLITT
jgi:hypothetical protein